MPPQTPLLLVDNVFDAIGLYPGALVDASSEAAGREAFRVADYRRDRTSWQAASDGGGDDAWVRVNLLASVAVNAVWLDRGHNLAGKTIYLEGSADGSTWATSIALNVPSAVGGTPAAPTMCQTEEGAAWSRFATTTARLWWRIRVPYAVGFIPLITGVIAGAETQLLGFSRTFDEDAAGRTTSSMQSTAGYRASETTYTWRSVELDLAMIGSSEYDGTIRTLRDRLFSKNQPWVCFMDAGTHPERGWLYQYEGDRWGMSKQRVQRNGKIVGREVGPRLA